MIIPKKKWYDRRFKLSEKEKQKIKENKSWLTMTKLAKKYWVSRTTIGNVQFPDRYKMVIEKNKESKRICAKLWLVNREKEKEYRESTKKYRSLLVFNK